MPAPKDPEKRKEWIRKLRESHLGKTASDTTKAKMSVSHLGQPSYWTGKHMSKIARNNMSKSHIGKESWNKGLTTPIQTRKKMSKSMTGIKKTKKFRKNMSGKNHPRWKGGITSFLKSIRELPEMYEWKSNVMKRDNYRDCFSDLLGSGNLEAHHIKPVSIILKEHNIKTVENALKCKELWNINNGITMFKQNHINHHKKYKNKIFPKEFYFQKK